jgi:hypothetical protein
MPKSDPQENTNSFIFIEEGGSVQPKTAAGSRAGGCPEPRWWFSANLEV